ncbi:MAG TPA: SDR family NAD(P)-dependent oxidoreductase [Steroidobacteraceae bacterium]|nr:SDR family NAD(P)-dependent oxidoreductase [Steroidobacteraceae bacterium]
MRSTELKAIVTGGASGLGLAVARRVIADGGRAALLDVQAQAGAAAARELGPAATFLHCDVTDEAGVSVAVSAAQAALGGLNLLVNCAGVVGAGKLLGKEGPMAGSFFAKVVAINLIGTFHADKAAAALMQGNAPNADGERGLIIHTASVAAYEGQIGQIAYSATKAGVIGLVLPMARELARFGIRVMAIAPGIFETPMVAGMSPELQKSLGAQVPFPPRLGRPAEYADLVLAIAANPMLNGETIRLDGAIRMQPR